MSTAGGQAAAHKEPATLTLDAQKEEASEAESQDYQPPAELYDDINIPIADYDPDTSDSAYGDEDDALSTMSLSSSILEHRWENGRRYHAYRSGAYWGPNDDIQNDQLDIAHQMFLILLHGKLHLAPVTNPLRVLDLGCGTGIWCIDFADQHEGSEVTGVDLSPIQPAFAPPNCKFEIDDVTAPWTWTPNFDFVNIRALYGSIADWPALYSQIYTNLKPGGYLHQLEMSIQMKSDDGSLKPDHILSQWSDIFHEAGDKFGKSFKAVYHLRQWIETAGFNDVHEVWYKVPVGGWSSDPHLKELGQWNLLHCLQGAEGWGLFLLTNVMGWSVEEAQVFIAKFRNGLKDRSIHAYFEVVVVYGRKPSSEGVV